MRSSRVEPSLRPAMTNLYSAESVRTFVDLATRRAKWSTSHGRIDTSQLRIRVTGICCPKTSMLAV